jgi:putative phosphoesterase
MNNLTQLDSTLVASPEAASALENAPRARLLVVSDSHGDSRVLEEIIRLFGEDCHALVHCGDGAGDLLPLFDLARRDNRFAALLPPVILAVRGNGDGDTYPLDYLGDRAGDAAPLRHRFTFLPRSHFRAAGKTIFVAHGNGLGVDYGTDQICSAAAVFGADIILHGHTHRHSRHTEGGVLILNPGSCRRPRDSHLPSFAVHTFPGTAEPYQVEFIEIHHHPVGPPTFAPMGGSAASMPPR